jgi:hypothetical protein
MITNLWLGMTLFLKPSGHCRAQMYGILSQAFKTWHLVTARRIAAKSVAAKISTEAHADARIAAEAKVESAAREFAASHIAGVDARIAQEAVAKAEAIMKLAAGATADPSPSPSTGHSTNIYGHSLLNTHISELVTKMYTSIPKWSLT